MKEAPLLRRVLSQIGNAFGLELGLQHELNAKPPRVRCGRAGYSKGRTQQTVPPLWAGVNADTANTAFHMMELTPLDLVPVVFNTVVAVTCVLHGPSSAAGPASPATMVHCLQQAVHHVHRLYPLIAGRLLPMKKACKLTNQPVSSSSSSRPSHVLVYQAPSLDPQIHKAVSTGSQPPVLSGSRCSVQFGVPVVAVQFSDMTWQAVQHTFLGRTGYMYADGCECALPPFCQVIDVGRMHAGKEPLLKLQVSWVPGPNTGSSCVLLGITVSHIAADAATLNMLGTELCHAYHAALHTHSFAPQPVPILPPDAAQQLVTRNDVSQQVTDQHSHAFQATEVSGKPGWSSTNDQHCDVMLADVQSKVTVGMPPSAVRRTQTPVVPVHAVATDDGTDSAGTVSVASVNGGLVHTNTSSVGWSVHTNPGSMPEIHDLHPSSPGKHGSMVRYDRSSLQYSGTSQHLPLSSSSQRYFQSVFVPLQPTGIKEACKAGSALMRGLWGELRVLGYRALVGPTTLVLHIRKCDLESLKDACQPSADSGAGSSVKLSSHDICAGFLWLLCTSMRGRPLPGQPLEPKFATRTAWGRQLQDRMFGVTLDLRRNCKPSRVVEDHLGNASASLHVRHADDCANLKGMPIVPWPCTWQPDAAADVTAAWLTHLANDATADDDGHAASRSAARSVLTSIVAGAAMRVRAAVNTFRTLTEAADVVVAEFAAHAQASIMDNACVLSRYVAQFDGFLSSWTSFPNMCAAPQLLGGTGEETGSTTTLNVLQPVIHNLAPWTALAVTAPPPQHPNHVLQDVSKQNSLISSSGVTEERHTDSSHAAPNAMQNGACGAAASSSNDVGNDGVMLYLTVPAAAEKQLRDSRVVAALLPHSKWLSA